MTATAQLASRLPREPREACRAGAAAAPAGHVSEFLTGMHAGAVERALAKRQMLVLPAAALRLTCLDGELWLTRDGDIEDYVLGPGQSLDLASADKALVQALRPSRLRLAAA